MSIINRLYPLIIKQNIQATFLVSFSIATAITLLAYNILPLTSRPLSNEILINILLVILILILNLKLNTVKRSRSIIIFSVFSACFVISLLILISLQKLQFPLHTSNYYNIPYYFYTILLFLVTYIFLTLSNQTSIQIAKDTPLNKKYASIILLTLIILSNFILKLILATKITIHIDESYTNMVTYGLFKYHSFGLTESGISYKRSLVFNILNSVPYLFFTNFYLKLRFFNILLFTISIPYIYLSVRLLTKNKLFALISTFFICNNWYILLITTVARSYAPAMVISVIVFYLIIKISTIDAVYDKKKLWIHISLLMLLVIIDYFQASNLGVYHLLPLLGLTSLFLLGRVDKVTKLLFFILALFSTAALAIYIIFINSTIIKMVVEYINPMWRTEHIFTLGSLNFYFNQIGVVILIASLVASLLNFKKNTPLGILALWILSVIFFQGYIYGQKTFDFRYLFSIVIPVVYLVIYYSYSLFTNPGGKKIIGGILIMGIVASNIFNIYNLYSRRLDWTIQTPEPWEVFLDKVPKESTIITDYPIVIHTLRPDLKIYKFSYHPLESELLNEKLDVPILKQPFTDLELSRFFSFVKKQSTEKSYVIFPDQQYCIYTSAPKIMNNDHLIKIIKSQKNVFALITYDVKKNKQSYLDEYQTLMSGEVLEISTPQKNPFDDRITKPIDTLTLLKFN